MSDDLYGSKLDSNLPISRILLDKYINKYPLIQHIVMEYTLVSKQSFAGDWKIYCDVMPKGNEELIYLPHKL